MKTVTDAAQAVCGLRRRVPFPRRQHDPPLLYAWDISAPTTLPATGSQCGVTDDQEKAMRHVQEGLATLPYGSHGKVRKVEPSGRLAYITLSTVAEARRTADGVSWL